tara:strand:- start:1595 stop:2086 length:492 start_codon:yes stop_codon:yes gene_type:complete
MATLKLNNAKACDSLSREILSELVSLAKRHGLQIERGRGTFDADGTHFSLKLEISAPNESGELLSKEAKDFQTHALSYGLKPEALGQRFKGNVPSGKAEYEIIGAMPRARKYPILAKKLSDGKTYKFGSDYIQTKLGAEFCATFGNGDYGRRPTIVTDLIEGV